MPLPQARGSSYDKKGSGKQNLTYDEAVEEALCFGWIDSRPNTQDEERRCAAPFPGNEKSPWSRLPSNHEKLIEQAIDGTRRVRKIATAQQDGSWSLLDAIEELKLSLTSKKL